MPHCRFPCRSPKPTEQLAKGTAEGQERGLRMAVVVVERGEWSLCGGWGVWTGRPKSPGTHAVRTGRLLCQRLLFNMHSSEALGRIKIAALGGRTKADPKGRTRTLRSHLLGGPSCALPLDMYMHTRHTEAVQPIRISGCSGQVDSHAHYPSVLAWLVPTCMSCQ